MARAQQPATPVIDISAPRHLTATRLSARVSPGPQREWLCRGRERHDRLSLRRERAQSAAGAGRDLVRRRVNVIAVSSAPARWSRPRRLRRFPSCSCSGRPGSGLVLSRAFRGRAQYDRGQFLLSRAGVEAAGAPACPGARGHACGCAAQSGGADDCRRPTCGTWKPLPAPWDCNSAFSMPAPSPASTPPSRHLANERPDALFISSGPFSATRRVQLVLLATRYAILRPPRRVHTPRPAG